MWDSVQSIIIIRMLANIVIENGWKEAELGFCPKSQDLLFLSFLIIIIILCK